MKYRSKPKVIDAVQFAAGFYDHIPVWLRDAMNAGRVRRLAVTEELKHLGLAIETLDGVLTVAPGDYIVRGIEGEIYPCKPDIFAATYEPVHD